MYTVQSLLPGDCLLGMQVVYNVSEPTSRELSAGMNHFILFPNLHPGDCLPEVEPVYTVF